MFKDIAPNIVDYPNSGIPEAADGAALSFDSSLDSQLVSITKAIADNDNDFFICLILNV